MKKSVFVILFIFTTIYSCQNKQDLKTKTIVRKVDSLEKFEESKGEKLFKENCAGCHSFGHVIVGPAFSSFNYDYFIDYYNGLIKQDSVYLSHRAILSTKEDWEEIAIHTFGGCMLGSSTYKSDKVVVIFSQAEKKTGTRKEDSVLTIRDPNSFVLLKKIILDSSFRVYTCCGGDGTVYIFDRNGKVYGRNLIQDLKTEYPTDAKFVFFVDQNHQFRSRMQKKMWYDILSQAKVTRKLSKP